MLVWFRSYHQKSLLSSEEFESLKQSIKEASGLYVPIIVNQEGIILDGHHRFKACQELEIEPRTIVREFSDKLEERLFVIDCNLIRRQLNHFQRTELALKSKPILEAIVKENESRGGKGDRNLTPLGRVNDRIGERAGVSRDIVSKVEKLLKSKRISDKTKEDLRSGKLTINGVYEQDQEGLVFYQKCRKAADQLNNSVAEIDNLPERTIEEKERLRAQDEKLKAERPKLVRKYSEKLEEYFKAMATFSFWIEYRENRNHDIESVAGKTLTEIVRLGVVDEMQTIPWQTIEQILHHAVIENKADVNMIRNSKAIQAQLEFLHREQEIGDSLYHTI
jgi:ParB-like chromosome segregation protein Spo0J